MRYYILALIMLVNHYKLVASPDTLHVYFDNEVYVLNSASRKAIDSLVYYDVLSTGKNIGIIGYADQPGSNMLNASLSLARARSVAAYLTSMGIDKAAIQTVEGKGATGQVGDTKANAMNRRVDIIPGGLNVKPAPTKSTPVVITLENIHKADKNSLILLENIEFQGGTDVLLPQSAPTLEKLFEILQRNPTMTIQVEGHVCCYNPYKLSRYPGKAELSLKQSLEDEAGTLSLARAVKVRNYLIDKGINRHRLKVKALGSSVPLYLPDGKTIDTIRNHRRVEIRILSK